MHLQPFKNYGSHQKQHYRHNPEINGRIKILPEPFPSVKGAAVTAYNIHKRVNLKYGKPYPLNTLNIP